MTNDVDVDSYLGMNVRKFPNGSISMSQNAIIDKNLNSLGISDELKMHDTPANLILSKDEDGNGRRQ